MAQQAVSQPEPWGAVLWFIDCAFQSSLAHDCAPRLSTACVALCRAEPSCPGESQGILPASTSSQLTSLLTFSLEVAFGLGAWQLKEEGEKEAEPAPGACHLQRSQGHGHR